MLFLNGAETKPQAGDCIVHKRIKRVLVIVRGEQELATQNGEPWILQVHYNDPINFCINVDSLATLLGLKIKGEDEITDEYMKVSLANP